jgi:hypothetical protein
MAVEEVAEEIAPPWNADSSFGIAMDHAAEYLFQIFHDGDFPAMF